MFMCSFFNVCFSVCLGYNLGCFMYVWFCNVGRVNVRVL